MQTGALGEIVFTVSDKEIKTFNNFSLSGAAKISAHARHNNKDMPEFTGLSDDSVSLSVKVSKVLGTDPQTEINKLKEYMNLGRLLPLTIGKVTHNYRWLINSIKIDGRRYDGNGTPIEIDITIKLTEYPRN